MAAKKKAAAKRKAAKKKVQVKKQQAAKAAARASKIAAKKPAAPAAPKPVNPFLTGGDLGELAQFTQDYQSRLQQIDFDLQNLATDTTMQKGQVDKGAKVGSAAATDDAIGRGLFKSSIRDAALYDIEATRSLQQKFLDDKLTAAKLDAGTQKGILARGKESFDKAMAQRKLENARPINDAAFVAHGDAKALHSTATRQHQQRTKAAQKVAANKQSAAQRAKAALQRIRKRQGLGGSNQLGGR